MIDETKMQTVQGPEEASGGHLLLGWASPASC
jgi:hypothetical protein